MNFRRKRKKNFDVDDIDITSLLDILVILLVFLLKSFNDSDLTVDLVNELALPYSMSRVAANSGVIVQVNKKRNVFVNTDVIGNMSNPNTLPQVKLKLEEEHRKRVKMMRGDKPDPEKIKLVNFVFDKGLKYSDINQVIEIASDAGYGKYKLIIQGEE
jgi:biopolymer transport protein ExbD